jgi:hypothetical protein
MEEDELSPEETLFEEAFHEWYARVGRFIRVEGKDPDRVRRLIFRGGWDART